MIKTPLKENAMTTDKNIIETRDFAADVSAIIKIFRTSRPITSLIFIDGFPNAGKTKLAKFLSTSLQAKHIEFDEFIHKEGCINKLYTECINRSAIRRTLVDMSTNKDTVVVDGICMNCILPVDEFFAFRIYIQRDAQFKINIRLHKEVSSYYQRFAPDESAQLIVINRH